MSLSGIVFVQIFKIYGIGYDCRKSIIILRLVIVFIEIHKSKPRFDTRSNYVSFKKSLEILVNFFKTKFLKRGMLRG